MRRLGFITREAEPVEFRPISGWEHEWASNGEPRLSRLWNWAGSYPLLLGLSLWLVLMGAILVGSS